MNKDFDAVKIIGIPAMLEQTAEEASELAQACLKMSRKLRGENPTPKNMIQIRNELLEEIADVMNCLDQLVEYSDVINAGGSLSHESIDSMRIYKMERWEQRLNTVEIVRVSPTSARYYIKKDYRQTTNDICPEIPTVTLWKADYMEMLRDPEKCDEIFKDGDEDEKPITIDIHHPDGKLPTPDKERKVKDIQYMYDPITNTNKKRIVYDDETIEYE